MMFWLVAALMLAAVLVLLVRAVVAEPATDDAVQSDVAFFKAREAEIAAMVAEGALTEEEATAARAEQGRKLLSRAREARKGNDAPPHGRAVVPVALVTIAALLAVPFYLGIGGAGMPDRPFDGRTDISRPEQDMLRLVARLDAHLAEAPDDLRGLEVAFPIYMRLGRFDDAARATERIAALKPTSADAHANHAEALIFAGGGAVSDEARKAIEKAVSLDPALPRARFYAGLAAEQGGDSAKALGIWRALEGDLKDGPEKQAVGAQIRRLAAASGHPPAPSGAVPPPDAKAADAVRALPEAEQKQMIRSMVDGLEKRLLDNGGSPDEWQRLLRALGVLGEKDRATVALGKAIAAHGSGQDAERIRALGRELGLVEGGAK